MSKKSVLDSISKYHFGKAWLAGFILAIFVGSFFFSDTFEWTNQDKLENEVSTATTTTIVEGPILPKSTPTRLRIPKINIDTDFVPPLDLEKSGEVAVPDSYTQVGWYKHSPTPGALGPAVILGHVDSYTGPAIFFSLGQLQEGDDVFVEREDGTTAHFQVTALERPKQSEFPTARVYGNINHAGLRLITCSGIFLHGEQRYTNNLIVYAKLVE